MLGVSVCGKNMSLHPTQCSAPAEQLNSIIQTPGITAPDAVGTAHGCPYRTHPECRGPSFETSDTPASPPEPRTQKRPGRPPPWIESSFRAAHPNPSGG